MLLKWPEGCPYLANGASFGSSGQVDATGAFLLIHLAAREDGVLANRGARVDAASGIFSVGCVLFKQVSEQAVHCLPAQGFRCAMVFTQAAPELRIGLISSRKGLQQWPLVQQP